jgi:hypothetical protein
MLGGRSANPLRHRSAAAKVYIFTPIALCTYLLDVKKRCRCNGVHSDLNPKTCPLQATEYTDCTQSSYATTATINTTSTEAGRRVKLPPCVEHAPSDALSTPRVRPILLSRAFPPTYRDRSPHSLTSHAQQAPLLSPPCMHVPLPMQRTIESHRQLLAGRANANVCVNERPRFCGSYPPSTHQWPIHIHGSSRNGL